MHAVLRRRARPLSFLLLLLAAVAAGCSGPVKGTGPDVEGLLTRGSAQADLDAARAIWAQRKPAVYRFVVRRSCECLPDATRAMRIQVRRHGGAPGELVESVTFADDGKPVPEIARPPVLTVDGMLALIERAIDERAARIVVTYDARFGYPRSIAIDWDPQMADEEDSYVLSNLEVIS